MDFLIPTIPPILITLHGGLDENENDSPLFNHKTNWNMFRDILEQNMEISLKTNNELDSAVAHLNDNILYAATQSTPSIKMITLKKTPAFIRDKIRQKRKLRRI